MSAITRLYISNHKVPKWTEGSEGEEIISESNYLIPILWLAKFCELNLMVWLDPDGDSDDINENRVPMVARVKEKCISSLRERKHLLGSIFSKSTNYIDEFISIIEKSQGKYISIDMSELFYFLEDPEQFFEDLQVILKMYDDGNINDLEPILRMADIQEYSNERKDFLPNEFSGGYVYQLCGTAIN